jgi:multisubunit Na+/H+ antiporter MnhB subunit
MTIALIALVVLMVLGAIAALEAKDLLSSVILLGIIGFALVLAFLILQAPDLAIVQIVVETLTLVILIAAIKKTTRKDETLPTSAAWPAFLFLLVLAPMLVTALGGLPAFGAPVMRMAGEYVRHGLGATGAANLVASVILDYRAYDTLGEATVLFTAVTGVVVVLRGKGRRS